MEQKLVRVPFDVEMAKKITNGEIEGKIVTRDGKSARIVCWDRKGIYLPIVALVDNGKGEEAYESYMTDGRWSDEGISNSDLMLEIPECMTFKDGDMAVLGWEAENEEFCQWITILKSVDVNEYEIWTNDYVTLCLKHDGENYFPMDFDCGSDGAKWIRKPTEAEKQKLIDALKASKELKAKEYLKRFFGIEEKKVYEFKPKDWVLCRGGGNEWCLCRFSHKTMRFDGVLMFVTVGGIAYEKCIPYNEQTAHLLGTTDNWEE